jgi:hypothetical protein
MQAHEERQRPPLRMPKTTLREPIYGINAKSIYREALLALRQKRHGQQDDWAQAERVVSNAVYHLKKEGRMDLIRRIEAEWSQRAEKEIAVRTAKIEHPETSSAECLRLLTEIDQIKSDRGIYSENLRQSWIGAGMAMGMALTGGC